MKTKKLVNTLNTFIQWLGEDVVYQFHFVDKKEDWLVRPLEKKNTAEFNINICSFCDESFFDLVLVHEFYHLHKQGIPHKSDVKHLKDAFGNNTMTLFDLEADVITAQFFRHHTHINFTDYLNILFEGRKVFLDTQIRISKFERFLGSVLSIYQTFESKNKTLFLPYIGKQQLTGAIDFFVVSKEHLKYISIPIADNIIQLLKESYYSNTIDLKNYQSNIKTAITELTLVISKTK